MAGVYLVDFMPICSIISIPYWNENTIPSWAARRMWLLLCYMKFTPCIDQPVSRFAEHTLGSVAEREYAHALASYGALRGQVVHFGIA